MAKMRRSDFAAMLNDIKSRILSGDSWDGQFAYTCIDDDLLLDEVRGQGAYRVGNAEGQGGMRVISADVPASGSWLAEETIMLVHEQREPPISRKDQHIRDAFLEALLDLRKAYLGQLPFDKFSAVTAAIADAYPEVIEQYEQEVTREAR